METLETALENLGVSEDGSMSPEQSEVHERLAKQETTAFMMETHIQEILTRVERIETEEMVNVQSMATQHAKALEEEVEARAVLEGDHVCRACGALAALANSCLAGQAKWRGLKVGSREK